MYIYVYQETYTYTSTTSTWQNLHLDVLHILPKKKQGPWHLADLLLRGVPGQAQDVLGEKNGGSSGVEPWETMGKPWKTMRKPWENHGKWKFHQGCPVEKMVISTKLEESWTKKVVDGHKLSGIEKAQIRFPLLGETIPSSLSAIRLRPFYKFPKLHGFKLQ